MYLAEELIPIMIPQILWLLPVLCGMSDETSARLRAAYKAVSPDVVEDIASMMAKTAANGRAAGIGLVVARFHTMRGALRATPKKTTEE